MNSLLYYLIQVVAVSGILYGYYHIALRNKRFHQYNRFYLIGASIASLVIPFLNIPVYFSANENPSFIFQTLNLQQYAEDASTTSLIITDSETSNPYSYFYFAYILVSVIFLSRILVSLYKIQKLRRENSTEQLDDIFFINTGEPGTPFSFFRWMFWNREIPLQSEKGEQIFRHELFHIRQRHSIDTLFLELLTTICWINPFFHLIKKEVKAIHEFLADQYAIQDREKWSYAELLLMQALNTRHSLVNPFFHNQIKRRIAMITTSKKPGHQYTRKILVLPLLAVVVGLFAFTYKTRTSKTPASMNTLMKMEIPVNSQTVFGDTPRIKPFIELKIAKITISQANGKKNGVVSNEPGLFIIEGRKITRAEAMIEFKNATIDAEELIATPANDEKAIETYGEVARNGVLEFKNVRISKSNLVKIIALDSIHQHKSLKNVMLVIDGEIQPEITTDIALKNLDPKTIESITILKDKNAVDLYGPKAVKGVIVVKTKVNAAITLNEVELVETKVASAKKESKDVEVEIKEVEVEATKIEDPIFEKIEISPAFQGGMAAQNKFIAKHLDLSVPLKNKALPGNYTVWIQLKVDKDGNQHDISAVTKFGYGMEQEAIRVLKLFPPWVPGIQNGRVVNSFHKVAFNFDIQPK